MADYAPNFTARYRVRYTVLGLTHTMQWRIARGAGVTGLNNMTLKVAAFLAALETGLVSTWTVLSATYAAEDSDIFLPAAAPANPTGTQSDSGSLKSQSILSTGFVGRSNLGQKARVFVYGFRKGPEDQEVGADDFRLLASENSEVDDAVTVLNNGSPNVVGSDDAIVSWYSYANVKFNDYWLRQIRG